MRRFLISMSIAMLIIMILGSPTLAAQVWCAHDPIVLLAGVECQFIVSFFWDNVLQVS